MKETRPDSPLPTLRGTEPHASPRWALLERDLIDRMNEAAVEFTNHYTRPDGTLIWRQDWPGMDGSDDAYESFRALPLFYILGGAESLHDLSRRQWDVLTWQWTEYGQVHREFDAYYDWMHHGESYIYLYYLGLADPGVWKDRQRARNFAAMYLGEDPEAPNYDQEKKLIRSPINGSMGPRFEMTAEDWCTHRWVLSDYPPPFEDLPGGKEAVANWEDEETFRAIIACMNQRMARGDVPLNLNATGLITHAFLYNRESRYRDWVLEYLHAWRERTRANGGILPDNVGPTGAIGENFEGKWWGGYYGWRWPHGSFTLLEPILNAGANALLLTGDDSHLDLMRSQWDLLWELGRKNEDGVWVVPNKRLDAGWSDFRPPLARFPIHLWNHSMAGDDLERVERLCQDDQWSQVTPDVTKGDDGHTGQWFHYIRGNNPDYPEQILRANTRSVEERLQQIRGEKWYPEGWDIHHWQQRTPVITEALVQLTLGGPAHVYHGGLLHCRVRYYDAVKKRPGLPDDVAALVEGLDDEVTELQLINLHTTTPREVIIQAGAFGEHRFTEAALLSGEGAPLSTTRVDGPWLRVVLDPGAGARLRLGTQRYVRPPSYDTPWTRAPHEDPLIEKRRPDIDPGSVRPAVET